VDLAARTLRLDPHTTKNDDAREAVMPQNLFMLVQQCATGKKPEEALFTREGKPVTDLRGAWEAAAKEAGVPDLLFHDLRRSAARNMDRRGISRSIAMKIMGHKTESMYRRYRIGDHADLREAARKMEQPILTVDVQFNGVAPAVPVVN
jgi:integrase